jgi:hypothetical protein
MNRLRNQQVYILRLKSGKYYVGISLDPWRRWLQHVKGTGALICRYDPPDTRIWTRDLGTSAEWCAKVYEDYITIFWMVIYGSARVIGGQYTDKQYRSASKGWCEAELSRLAEILGRDVYKNAGFLDINEVPINEHTALLSML